MKVFATTRKPYLSNYKHTPHNFLQKQFTTSSQSDQVEPFNGDKPNVYDLLSNIQESTNLRLHNHGQHLHSHIFKSGFTSNPFISSALINFYVKMNLIQHAHNLFDEMPEPSLASWNSLISGYARSRKPRQSLTLFLNLKRSNLYPDSYSYTPVLSVCGKLNCLNLGKCIHSLVVKSGVESNTFVSNCLIDMYGKCEAVEDGINVFNKIQFKDTISWNSVIGVSVRNRRIKTAVSFFNQMPNPDTITYNEIISGIALYGNMEHAIEILLKMESPNSSSWNAILTGYVNRDDSRNGFKWFCKMRVNGVRMDEFTFSSVLSGVARVGAFKWGTAAHCCVVKVGFDESVVVGSALVDMYAKCGQVNVAEFVFELLPEKNLVTWNAMISGFAHNEDSNRVIELFERMRHMGDVEPDGITFLNLLSACWHRKMGLEVATRYLEMMMYEYKIDPTVEHCCTVIRVMGCEGEVWRGEGMIKRLGFEGCGGVWRALLAACGVCGDLKVAESAARKVVELEGDGEFVYVMMSNIYARFGKWEDAGEMRKMMRDKKVSKEAGFSWIE